MASSKKNHLPISRVRTIMKSSPDVENISGESVHLVARAAELFIKYLAKESHSRNQDKSQLQYKDIASVVNQDQELEFLRELIPMKITFKEYKEMMKNKKEHWVLPPLPKEANEEEEQSEQGDQEEQEEQGQEAGQAQGIEEAQEAQEIEEAEEAQEAQEIEIAEEAQEVEIAEEAQEIEIAEEAQEIEVAEEAQEIEVAEEAQEIEIAEEAKEAE